MPRAYYEQGGITIYHGDCREVLPGLGPFDLALTDMPYGEVNRKSSGLRRLDKGVADIVTAAPAWVAEQSARASSAYVFCGTEQVSDIRRAFVERGMTTRVGIWEKTNPSPMNGQHLWLSSVECCVFARRRGAVFTEHCASPVWRFPVVQKGRRHPTEKPLSLFKRLVSASSNPGDLVVDSFMGSGTTLEAARDLGRRAIGVELEERYCEIAARRLEQEPLPRAG